MESDKCKILWDFIVKTYHEIYGRKLDVIVVQKEKSLSDNRFNLHLWWKSWYLRIRKNRTLPRFGMRVEKDMEHVSQGYTTTDRCSKNNINKVTKLVKGNRYWNSAYRVAEDCPPTHCSNHPKGSWGLTKLAVTGPQEYKSTAKKLCYVIIWQ